MASQKVLQVAKQSASEKAYTNFLEITLAFNRYVNPLDFAALRLPTDEAPKDTDTMLVEISWPDCTTPPFVFPLTADTSVSQGSIGFNGTQRATCELALDAAVTVTAYEPRPEELAGAIRVDVELKSKLAEGSALVDIDMKKLQREFEKRFQNQVLRVGQELIVKVRKNLTLTVESVTGNADSGGLELARGQYATMAADVEFVAKPSACLRFTNAELKEKQLFSKKFDFNQLGIGGLDDEFNQIFRRTFASRMYPPKIVAQLGIAHVKGMLLYGPPGCGKTLIARKIGEVLNAREPKIVNGPEILDKYVGGSEEKVRALFKDAEEEMKREGENSMLHIVIFDEFDAIVKSRGSTNDNTGVSDSVVNQLLAKIDGVESLNNILIIGMTNRKDLIDDAILRPGRLEVHVEIGLPNEKGRLQILNIHTAQMRNQKRVSEEAVSKLPLLAEMTKNYSGAELAGLVRAATSNALHRNFDSERMVANPDDLMLQWIDFDLASKEVRPAFGAPTESLRQYAPEEWVPYNLMYQDTYRRLLESVEQVRTSEKTSLLTILLEGDEFVGKTSLAAKMALESQFPFVRMLTPDQMIGLTDLSKCSKIQKIFNDASKSDLSIIVLDDLERLLEYTPQGPRFSNMVLQTLLIMLKKIPANGRLLVIATTSVALHLEALQLTSAFNISYNIPKLDNEGIRNVLKALVPMSSTHLEEVCDFMGGDKPIAIKQLLMVSEMARQGADSVTADRFSGVPSCDRLLV